MYVGSRRTPPNWPPKLRPTLKRIVLIAVRTFIPIRVNPAKAAINSDQAIAGKQTGALLPCQERSASHRAARSNYPLKTEYLRAPRLAADARLQPSARNVRFGSYASFLATSATGLLALQQRTCPLGR